MNMQMKALLALLAVAAAATAWVVGSRSAPTYAVPREPPSAFAPAPAVLLSAPGPAEVVRRFHVEGMCCQGCTGKLHKAISSFPGVREACVDFESESACVIAAESVSTAELERALTFDKYQARLEP